ncbi:glycoside hydrolase family 13 protein [Nitrospira sp. Kam-Ns4a]
MTQELPWWQGAVIYQIYPWSFQDSDGDGIGDLPGIVARLGYLNGEPDSLGVDAVWLSPIFPSPMKDFGYDVAEYCDVDPRFGSLKDFDRLVEAAHRRGIRVILDLVLNHTSDQHPWFREARASRAAPKRDWYYWAEPRRRLGGWWRTRPSNWQSVFGGPAWEWDARTGQYYLHSFLKEQPDLNWRHPAVREAMLAVVRFWLERGVDGFRLDAINWIGKDTSWPDNPRRLGLRAYTRQVHRYDRDQPDTHEVLRELRLALREYPEAVLIGEASADTPGGPAVFYGDGSDELHLAFNFRLLKSPWRADRFRQVIREWDRAVPPGAWPTQVLSNHDQSRHRTRYGRGADTAGAARRARAAALLLLTLRGTPFLYYGEEIGMGDVRLTRSQLRDPFTRRYWPFRRGRDPARTPMQWDASPHAGFTTGTPWLPVSPDFARVNVAAESADPASLLALYRRLIRLRRASPALRLGAYREVPEAPDDCLVYLREAASERVLVAVNFTDRGQTFALPSLRGEGELLLSTDPGVRWGPFDSARVRLGPDEGILVRMGPRGGSP